MNPGRNLLSSKAFTLLELMVVMLLISIILAVSIPKFDSGIGQDPVKRVTRRLINTARALRSEAVQKQKMQTLVIDFTNNRMWMINENMDEDAKSQATEKAFKLPSSIRIANVVYPDQDRELSDTAQINYYPAGHSDRAIILMEKDGVERFSYLIEPLLPKVKFFEEWLSF
ncbi:MAG: prepilin-type N-terminal cleavage/methylation domain-containing protein [Desulfobacteraceae bacterium]|nr:prepilin-type N-terminal cleavage/methylation domain-containing protein [Desulfobacteraceae bacterium]